MSRAETFVQDIIGMTILMALAGPVIQGVIAFVIWQTPDDWMSFWGLSLSDVRFNIGISVLYALYRQIIFGRECGK